VEILLIAVFSLPLLLLGPTWWFYRREGGSLPRWRKILFVSGIFANLASAMVLVSFIIQIWIISRGSKPVDLDRAYPVLEMLGLGMLTAMLGTSGRRVPRLLLIGNGLLTAIFWYLAGMGASP
jgi:hypothetical protein